MGNIQITEKWVGECAGGKVFREARALVKSGRVRQLKVQDGTYQAHIGRSEKPMRVVVKVMSATHVKNLCLCGMSRRTGAMCEHAAAILLATVMDDAENSERSVAEREGGRSAGKAAGSEPAPEVLPMDVRLSPKFPDVGMGNVSVVRSGRSADSLQQADYALALWLHQNTGNTGPAMLALPEKDRVKFFHALAGHPGVFAGKQNISVKVDELRHPLEMEPDPEFGSEMLWLRLVESDEVVLLGDQLVHWYGDQATLVLNKVRHEDVAGIAAGALSGGDWQHLETQNVLSEVESLSRHYILPQNLGGLRLGEADPGIVMRIAGSTRALQATLEASYPGGMSVPLGQQVMRVKGFPLQSPDDPHFWFLRNPEAELEATRKLMQYGFQPLDGSGVFYLRGEDETVDFLTAGLQELKQGWMVEMEDKLVHVQSRLGRIEPQIDVRGSGEDWLACDVSWRLGEEVVSADAVRRMLQSGNRTISRSGGGKAVISAMDAELMEGFLLDTDPRQEDGGYVFPREQAGYIEQLRAHYSGEREEQGVIDLPALPVSLRDVLRPYQQEGVSWLYQRAVSTGAALLADDMGLGKTLQTLTFMQLWKERNAGPMLVVCPATLLGNWRDEAAQWVPDLKVLVMHGQSRKKYFEVLHSADIVITSYALLDRDAEVYRALELSAMVLDEASAIRNPDTLAAKAARKMKAAVRVAISGTPVENSVRDLWSIFQFLMPGYLGGREDFRRRYELPSLPSGAEGAGASNTPARAALQRLRWRTAPFMLRRTKSLVAQDLPPKIESVVWCDPTPAQKEHYTAIMRQGAEKVDALRKSSGKQGARMQMLTVLLRLRQSCCDLRLLSDDFGGRGVAEVSAKLVRLLELLDEARRGNHRVLVFSQFTSMLGLIREALEEEGMGYAYLDGSTRDRGAVVSDFQNPEGPPVFLISLKAGGYGLTLTAADTVVLFDPWWNPAVEAQAADRIHRIGQTKPSTIYKLITRGTVEEKILRLQEKKKDVINAAMGEGDDDGRPMMSGLSEQEMLGLLEA